MINVYDSKEKLFNHNGLCILDGCIKCEVDEQINGLYKLELEYPKDERGKWRNLVKGNIIKASTPKGSQYFRISKVNNNINPIRVCALHIFYDLRGNFLEDTRPTNSTGSSAMQSIQNGLQYTTNFTFTSDIDKVNTSYFVRKNPVEALLGEDENSFLNRWGGEINRDNFLVEMKENLGTNRGITIQYGKNLTGIKIETDAFNIITKIMPTGLDENNNTVILPEKYIDSPLISSYPYPLIKEFHFQDIQVHHIEEGKEPEEGEVEVTLEDVYKKLREKAKELYNIQNIDKPLINYKINFIELSKTEEYKKYALLERIFLGDKVTVRYKELDVNVLAKVIRYKWDCLTDRYITIELGNKIKNLNSTLNKNISESNKVAKLASDTSKAYADGIVTIEEKERINKDKENLNNAKAHSNKVGTNSNKYTDTKVKDIISETKKLIEDNKENWEAAIKQSSNLIKNVLGGYVLKRENELLIMDTQDVNTATKVWRFNLNGLGFSNTGYSGTYETAITMDGKINGKFLQGEVIKGVTLQGAEIMSVDNPNWTDDGFANSSNSICKMSLGGLNFFSNVYSKCPDSLAQFPLNVDITGAGIEMKRNDDISFDPVILNPEGSMRLNNNVLWSLNKAGDYGNFTFVNDQTQFTTKKINIKDYTELYAKGFYNNKIASIKEVPVTVTKIAKLETEEVDIFFNIMSNWHDYNEGTYGKAKGIFDSNGFVHLSGAVSGGSSSDIIGTTAFKPKHLVRCPVATSSGAGVLEIRTDGDIKLINGSSSVVYLDGVTYQADW